MKVVIGTLFMGVAVAIAFALVVMNRESEKIVTASVPLAFATFAALALVFAFAREEPVKRVFPVNFCYQETDKLPIVVPYRPFPDTLALVDQLRQQKADALEEPPTVRYPGGLGGLVYHEFLQKALVDWIAMRHFGAWRMELLQFQTGGTQEFFQPVPDAAQEPSKVLSAEDLQRSFGANRFAGVHTGFGTLALPPGTSLSIQTPQAQGQDHGEIGFKNWFCSITIRTSPGLSRRGVGRYSTLVGVEPSASGYWTAQYIVRITVTFSRLLVGHPRMAAHKQWAMNIVDGLQDAFDEQVIWRRSIENYMLHQHLTGRTLPLRPVRMTPPSSAATPARDATEK